MNRAVSDNRRLVVIIGRNFGFPNGYGATVRVSALARGFKTNGASVHILCMRSTESSFHTAMNQEAHGEWMGIPFRYTCGNPVRSSSFLGRRIAELAGVAGAIIHLYKNRKQLHCIYYYSPHNLFIVMLIKLLSLFLRVPLVAEYTEFPFVTEKQPLLCRMHELLLRKLLCPMLDGLVVISTFLEKYFRSCLRKGRPMLRVPIFVFPADEKTEGAESSCIQKKTSVPLIVFSGNLEHVGEVEDLIEAVAAVGRAGCTCRLLIVGGSSSPGRMDYLSELGASVLPNVVIDFAGSVSRDLIPDVIAQADVLVLPRRSGLFSLAGFPTKLAEYMMTGIPVVVSGVGDIPSYLRNNEDAYIVEPGSVDSLAGCLSMVLANPEASIAVGHKGRDTAVEHFNAVTESRKILEMIDGLG